ncbi:V/A-type H+-transporting ATPase subunit I [Granulicatella balaenopterae]|uniref:V/A-type H+-transporting ATPase subunit I n=1 Tax=Granulicatella balaenopterae TaxID=137733 RepID=A0A1H9P5X6_9LACT|nr:V-type ATP synthase subunit I [Granulicatella balaenopterae]SER43646.1 V/A-type H+-transporting ATPase subunit I [Granulicatella balaenopterae]
MAIAKMKKVMLVAPKTKQVELLEMIQELQNLELIDNDIKELSEERQAFFSQQGNDDQVKRLQNQFDHIGKNLQFLASNQKQPSFFQKYKNPREEYTLQELTDKVDSYHIDSLIETVDGFERALRLNEDIRKDLSDKEEILRRWQPLDFHPKVFKDSAYLNVVLGTIPQVADNSYHKLLTDSDLLFVKDIYSTRDELGVCITYYKEDEAYVKEELNEAHFIEYIYSFKQAPKEELACVLKKQEELVESNQQLVSDIDSNTEITRKLELAHEVIFNELERAKSQELLWQTNRLFTLSGWIQADQFTIIKEKLKEQLDAADYAFFEQEFTEKEYHEVPIILENNAVVTPFENLTEMYGLPQYGELDPTPFMAPFYMVFFGMMAGDLGYGLLLWLATGALLKFLNLDLGTQKTLKFFHMLSYPTMAWGVIFGSFFGVTLPIQVLSLSNDLISVMILSIIFGVIQILVGLALGAYTNMKKKAYVDAYLQHFGWIAIILGIILYVVGTMVVPAPTVALAGKWLAIIAAILIVIVSILSAPSKAGGLASGLYNLYGISGYISDTVSYTRLMALAVSGGSIAGAFNMLVGFLPPVARFTLGIFLLIALHALNIFLTFLGAYVHGLRLQFVEYFGKFYEGGGRAFNPFKTYEKYIYIKKTKK